MYLRLRGSLAPHVLISILASVVVLSVLYSVYSRHSRQVSLETINTWLRSEQVAVQQGNLLHSVSKLQRVLHTSSILRGFALIDRSRPQVLLIQSGNTRRISDSLAKSLPASTKVDQITSRTVGLFEYVFFVATGTDPSLMLVFHMGSGIYSQSFIVVFGAMLGMLLLTSFFARKQERLEHQERHRLLQDAINNLLAFGECPDWLKRQFPSLEKWIQQRIEAQDLERHLQEQARLGNLAKSIARQVAHDIRSPLAALQMMSRDLGSMPEDQRIILRQSIARITDIANDLLNKKAHPTAAQVDQSGPATSSRQPVLQPELLSSILDSIVSEKRIQYRSQMGIEIEATLGQASYGIFANINPNEFKRVISNLINNAVEALPNQKGLITLDLKLDSSSQTAPAQALVLIKDNGSGIPPEVLARLGQEGFSHGKESHQQSGSGLGVFHARSIMEAFGGSIHYASTQGQGTTVTLKLPTTPAPAWFANNIQVGSLLVIADDDASIHQIWEGRAQSLAVPKKSIVHFSTPDQVLNWFASQEQQQTATLLIDYEFLGHDLNGLDVVTKLTPAPRHTYLVSSRYEEDHVRDRAMKLNITIVPKNLAPYVPVIGNSARNTGHGFPSSSQTPPPDFVLIDDDKMIGDLWVKIASQKGKVAQRFTSPEDFYAIMDSLPKSTPIYVDQSLENNVQGVDVTRKLFYDHGFTNLYLATGYDPSEFEPMPWIKGIRDKMPPV